MNKLTITRLILFGLFLLIVFPSHVLYAADRGIDVEQYWLADPAENLNPQTAMQRLTQGAGKPLTEKVFKLGNELQQIWVLIQVRNTTAQPQRLRLQTGVPYSRLLQASLWRDKQQAGFVILDEYEERIFAERNNRFRLLNSDAFSVQSGEFVQLLVQTQVEGASYVPFTILTEQAFNELQLQDSIFASLFYGFCLTLAVLFLLFSVAVKHRVAILYAVLFLLGLLIMADIDGHAFQWLWPNSPQWNHFSPLVILPITNALGFFIVYQLLESIKKDGFVLLKRLSLVFLAVALVVPFFVFVLPQALLIHIENLLSIPAFLLQPIAFTTWLHLGRRSYVSGVAIAIMSLVVVLLSLLAFIEVSLPEILLQHVHHFAYVVVSVMVMVIITVQLMGLHKDQQLALKRELVLAQKNADMNAELLEAEKNYATARQLASQHKQQLASASHDLRQPIVSLRSSVDAIATQQPSDVRQQLQQAFQYLEELCNQHLHTSSADVDRSESDDGTSHTEAYPVSLIFDTVQRMFTEEAAARQVELRKVDCSVILHSEPLVLMRIVSNLVANAIKHHPGGKRSRVLLGARRSAAGVKIQVCDNGNGMTPEEIKNLQRLYQKGTESDGEGLGLHIIQQLAKENGFDIRIHSEPGKGSCFVLQLEQ